MGGKKQKGGTRATTYTAREKIEGEDLKKERIIERKRTTMTTPRKAAIIASQTFTIWTVMHQALGRYIHIYIRREAAIGRGYNTRAAR